MKLAIFGNLFRHKMCAKLQSHIARPKKLRTHARKSHTCECARMFIMCAATHILRNMFKIVITFNFSLKSYVMASVPVWHTDGVAVGTRFFEMQISLIIMYMTFFSSEKRYQFV